jgi:hypothetical protein
MMLFRAAVSIALAAMQQSFPFVAETTSSYLESLLEASLDDGVLCSHTVSHKLRALFSPLLMPQQPPAVPAKVIYIAGKKNWTIATTLVAIFDDNYNDLSMTAPYVDPCRITQYDLGFPLGLVAEYGGFVQSIYAPLCLPPVKDSCTTLYHDPWQYLLDIITDDGADAIIDRYIPRTELEEAFWIWTYDQLDEDVRPARRLPTLLVRPISRRWPMAPRQQNRRGAAVVEQPIMFRPALVLAVLHPTLHHH